MNSGAIIAALRARRGELGLTQGQAAQAANVSLSTWSRIENETGWMMPIHSNRAAIARALQWPPDALDRIAAGEDPAALPTVDPNPKPADRITRDVVDEVIMLRGQVAELAQMIRDLVERDADPK